MKKSFLPILGLSCVLSTYAHQDTKSVNEHIEAVLSTYPQKIQDIVKQSYCYDYRENTWIQEKSRCEYDITGKTGILQTAQLRYDILEDLKSFPKESKIESTSVYHFFSYYGENLSNDRLLRKREYIRSVKKTLCALPKEEQQKVYLTQEWKRFTGQFEHFLAESERLGDKRGEENKHYLAHFE